jgi:hypothetical protein
MSYDQTGPGSRRRLALAAILLTATLFAACTDADEPTHRSRPSPTKTTTTSPTPSRVATLDDLPSPTVLRLEDLPTGKPPAVPYVDLDEVVFPNGRRVTLERPTYPGYDTSPLGFVTGLSYTSLARYAEGWVGTSYDDEKYVTTLHRFDGSFVRYLAWGGPVSVSRDGRWVLLGADAYGREIHLRGPRDQHVVWPLSHLAVPVGFVGPTQVAFNVVGRDGLSSLRVRVASPDGAIRTLPGLRQIAATSERASLVSGTESREPAALADTVYAVESGAPMLLAPGFDLAGFSPDGSLVVGQNGKWRGRRLLVASVETGEVLVQLRLPESFYGVRWEDDRHFLVIQSQMDGSRAGRYVIRVNLQGEAEVALQRPLPRSNFDQLTLTTSSN